MKKLAAVVLSLALGALFSCSSQPEKAEKKTAGGNAGTTAPAAPKKPQYFTGREAFYKMFASARAWAPDAKPVSLNGDYTQDAPSAEGKLALWHAMFASPAKSASKIYTWSGLEEGGVSSSSQDDWNPANASTQIFEPAYFKTDSDKAAAVAAQHGGKALLKKSPKQPITYTLNWDGRNSRLVWRVIYGASEMDAKLDVEVNASSGEFLRVEK